MKLSPTGSRRLAAGLGLACAAVLIPTAALASSAGSAAAGQPAVAACHASGTTVWTGSPGDGTAGTTFWQVEISNIGRHACTLFGYPGVSASNGAGHQIGVPATHSGARSQITIPAGGTAHFVLGVHDAGIFCTHPVRASFLKVFVPNQFASHLTPLSLEVCRHVSVMHVDAVHSGAGIPGFTSS